MSMKVDGGRGETLRLQMDLCPLGKDCIIALCEKQYIGPAGHWISRLAGEGIRSMMKETIDFPLFIWRTWRKAEGNFPPRAC